MAADLLNADERQAMRDLASVRERILVDWGLNCNEAELTAAVHTIQHFIMQRAASREHPSEFNDWYDR